MAMPIGVVIILGYARGRPASASYLARRLCSHQRRERGNASARAPGSRVDIGRARYASPPGGGSLLWSERASGIRHMSSLVGVPLTVVADGDADLFAELMEAVESVAATGQFTGGAAVEGFERDYAAWCAVPHARGLPS